MNPPRSHSTRRYPLSQADLGHREQDIPSPSFNPSPFPSTIPSENPFCVYLTEKNTEYERSAIKSQLQVGRRETTVPRLPVASLPEHPSIPQRAGKPFARPSASAAQISLTFHAIESSPNTLSFCSYIISSFSFFHLNVSL